jgi:hypothetical protein
MLVKDGSSHGGDDDDDDYGDGDGQVGRRGVRVATDDAINKQYLRLRVDGQKPVAVHLRECLLDWYLISTFTDQYINKRKRVRVQAYIY